MGRPQRRTDRQSPAGSAAPELRYAILELGLRCNLRCVHCASGSGEPRPGELDAALWSAVVEDLAELGCPAVDLMGGEVLLSPNLRPGAAALQRHHIAWGLISNGWLLDRRLAAELVALGCRGMAVSLDGARPETHDELRGRRGSHRRALRALEVLAGLDFKPANRAILTSVSTRNLPELDELGELLRSRFPGFRWQLNLCSAPAPRLSAELRLDGPALQGVARFIDRLRRDASFPLRVTGSHDLGYCLETLDLHDWRWEGCPAGRHNLGVQSDGQVKGCLALDASFAVGSVTEQRLAELWRDPHRFRRHRCFSPELLGEGCAGCVFGSLCRGGCTAASVALSGRPHQATHCLWRAASPEERARVERRVLPLEWRPPRRPGSRPRKEAWPLPLRSLCLELTRRCNLRCVHCGSGAGAAREDELELAELQAMIRSLKRAGGERLVILGGEPLLHPDWELLARQAVELGLQVSLISNGYPISAAIAQRLAGLGLSRVGISLDGASDAVHDGIRGRRGARRRAFAAIERLRGLGLPVTVITTLMRDNLGELEPMRDQLLEKSLVWQLQAANGTGARFQREHMLEPRDLLHAARFIEETRGQVPLRSLAIAGGHNIGHHACSVRAYGTLGTWQGCPGGILAAGVASDGTLKPCLSMSDDEDAGSLRHRSISALWRDPRSFPLRRRFRPAALRGGCASCPHGSLCRAGCPQMARTATGEITDNPFCLRQAEQAERC